MLIFVGIIFLLQAVNLILIVSIRNRELLQYDNSTSENLIVEYLKLHTQG